MYPERKILGLFSWLSYRFDLSIIGLSILFLIFLFIGVGSPIFLCLILCLIKPDNF